MIQAAIEATPLSISGQQTYDGQLFPLVLECRSPEATLEAAADWVRGRRDKLLTQAADHGTVLFRGFPLVTANDFDAFVAAFDLPNFPYEESLSNAVRINRTPRVFTANEAPPNITILFHHELAQTPVFPSRLFFFCEQPAATGGATPLCRSDILWERLVARCPQFCRDCEAKGLKYTNVMASENDLTSGMGRGWQSTLRAQTPAAAEARLAELRYSWEWLTGGELKVTTPVLPAVKQLSNGRKSFFNQLIAAFKGWKDTRNDPSKAITFGDGTPLDRDAVNLSADLAEELAFDVAWEKGDVALVDNFVTMHGRRTFTGTRKVLASLIACE